MSQSYTFPSVLFQGMTFTAKRWAQFPTITYVAGAVAGFEVVSVDSSLNITVQIASGVSTTAQVKAAIEATSPSLNHLSAGDLVSIVINTPGIVTAPATSSAMTGASAGNPGLGFYADQTIVTLTTSYQFLRFENVMGEIQFNNDDASGTNKLSISWDGVNVHGVLAPTQAMAFDRCNKSGVYVKYVNGSPAFRISTTAQ